MLIMGAQCDKCGARALWNNHSPKKYLVRWLRKDGWSIGKVETDENGHHRERTLCPLCSKKGE